MTAPRSRGLLRPPTSVGQGDRANTASYLPIAPSQDAAYRPTTSIASHEVWPSGPPRRSAGRVHTASRSARVIASPTVDVLCSPRATPQLLQTLRLFLDRELKERGCAGGEWGQQSEEGASTMRLQVFKQAFGIFIESFSTYRGFLSSVRAEYDSVLRAYEEKLRSAAQMKHTINNLEHSHRTAVDKMSADHRAEIMRLTSELMARKQEIIALEEQAIMLKSSLIDAEARFTTLKDSTAALEKRCELLSNSLRRKEAAMDDTQRKLMGTLSDNLILQGTVEKLRLEGDALRENNVALEGHMSSMVEVETVKRIQDEATQTSTKLAAFQSLYRTLHFKHSTLSRSVFNAQIKSASQRNPNAVVLDADNRPDSGGGDGASLLQDASANGKTGASVLDELLHEINSLEVRLKTEGHGALRIGGLPRDRGAARDAQMPANYPPGCFLDTGPDTDPRVPIGLRIKGLIRNCNMPKAEVLDIVQQVVRLKVVRDSSKARRHHATNTGTLSPSRSVVGSIAGPLTVSILSNTDKSQQDMRGSLTQALNLTLMASRSRGPESFAQLPGTKEDGVDGDERNRTITNQSSSGALGITFGSTTNLSNTMSNINNQTYRESVAGLTLTVPGHVSPGGVDSPTNASGALSISTLLTNFLCERLVRRGMATECAYNVVAALNTYADEDATLRAFSLSLAGELPDDFYQDQDTLFRTLHEAFAKEERVLRQTAVNRTTSAPPRSLPLESFAKVLKAFLPASTPLSTIQTLCDAAHFDSGGLIVVMYPQFFQEDSVLTPRRFTALLYQWHLERVQASASLAITHIREAYSQAESPHLGLPLAKYHSALESAIPAEVDRILALARGAGCTVDEVLSLEAEGAHVDVDSFVLRLLSCVLNPFHEK